ncbi:MAG TPA: ADP-ribosylglycohydrolase family protein [Thermodesulfobacteriota bacterium]|nr:ADP-ribosylglycohydrolase family protein [Thermodesulfobacteriota bacterium]
MIGAIAGDIIGSVRETLRTKRKDFRLFTPLSIYTDDTVLTVAVADAILKGKDYGTAIKSYARRHTVRGYGPKFTLWMLSPSAKPYNSLGNGSAMRVSPVAHAFTKEEGVLHQARLSAECTHNHPEGIKGAQATALAIFMARNKAGKEEIRETLSGRFGYNLSRRIDEIRPKYRTNLTCPGSVPEAIIAFLESESFEDSIRNAVSLGGDADTQAAIAGAIAEAFYGNIPAEILSEVSRRLNPRFKKIILDFYSKFGTPEMVEDSRFLLPGPRHASRADEG